MEKTTLKTSGQFVDRIYSTWAIGDGKECQRLQNAKEFLVAATFEKSKTYVFDGFVIMNPRTGGLPVRPPSGQPKELKRGW